MTDTIMVIAAHPDDELLGCAGSVARHVDAGDSVHVVILAEGATSRDPRRGAEARREELDELVVAAREAGRILGVSSVNCCGLPDNRMDGVELLDIVKLVEEQIARHRPSIIYTHHVGDVNIDHERTHRAVYTACRPTPGHVVKRLLAFETMSSTEWTPPDSAAGFKPNWFVDISATLERKLAALAVYEQEMRPWPHPRSIAAIEHLARWRGASIGVDAAEAFMLLRNLV